MNIRKLIADNATHLLTGAGIAGFAVTAVMAAKTAVKTHGIAVKTAEEADRKGATKFQKAKSVVLAVGPSYLPAVLTGVASAASIIYSDRLSIRKTAALSAAYSVAERALSTYQGKVVERLGEAAHEQIMDSIAEEEAEKAPDISDEDLRNLQGEGDMVVYDAVTGHVFKSDEEIILAAQGEVCRRICDETYAPLSTFYDYLGVDSGFALAETTGWDVSHLPDIRIASTLNPDGKVPKLAIYYHVWDDRGNRLGGR